MFLETPLQQKHSFFPSRDIPATSPSRERAAKEGSERATLGGQKARELAAAGDSLPRLSLLGSTSPKTRGAVSPPRHDPKVSPKRKKKKPQSQI